MTAIYTPAKAVKILRDIKEKAAEIQELAMDLEELRNNPDLRTQTLAKSLRTAAREINMIATPLLDEAIIHQHRMKHGDKLVSMQFKGRPVGN